MTTSVGDSWSRARETFAGQFEPYGTAFVYRRSQKGEAIPVSADERSKFLAEFDRNVRRSKWIIWLGLTVAVGGIIAFTVWRGSELSQKAAFACVALVMVPYLAFFRWAWTAPARRLAGRTPVAGPRSRDEVRRLAFNRITYGQLATAGACALVIPFVGSRNHDLFSVSNGPWLAGGLALLSLVAVQAFRKWRFEADDARISPITSSFSSAAPDTPEAPHPRVTSDRVWQFVPLVVVVIGVGFISLTAAGQRLAREPRFVPLLCLAMGAWALISVARAFVTGRAQPFSRGFSQYYQRDSQPKRYWASMTWNAVFGCGILFVAYQANGQASADLLADKCEYATGVTRLEQQVSACNEWVEREPRDEDVYLNRGLLFLSLGADELSIRDFTRAHELAPKDPWPLANRGLAWAWQEKQPEAEADFTAVRSLDATNPVMLRGEALLRKNAGDEAGAVEFLTQSMKRDPDNLWALQTRSELYWNLGNQEKSIQDDRRYWELRKKRDAKRSQD